MRNQKSIFNQNGGELLREVPEDGHVLILFETKDELKTFGDYQNLVSCLDAITEIYEQSKIVAGQDGSNYDVEQLWAWLDDAFPRLDVFIFDKEISRYKHTSRMEFKELFIQQLEKLSDSQEITCAKRRTSRLANDDDLIEDEISDWDDD